MYTLLLDASDMVDLEVINAIQNLPGDGDIVEDPKYNDDTGTYEIVFEGEPNAEVISQVAYQSTLTFKS